MYATKAEQKVLILLDDAITQLSSIERRLEDIEDVIGNYADIFDIDGEIFDEHKYNKVKYNDDNELKSRMKELIEIHNRLETVVKEYEEKVSEIF